MSELKYEKLVRDGMALDAILSEAWASGLDVLKFDGRAVTLKAGCLPVDVSWEMCLCHGGRIWLDQGETNIHIELSSDEYDVENGVTDAESELAWRIENELAERVRGFERYVHVIDTVGEYGDPDRRKRLYLDSTEKAARAIFEEGGHDLLTTREVVHEYPNKNIRLRVTYDGDECEDRGKARRIRFKCEKLKRKGAGSLFEVEYEYSREYWVYRKGLR